MTPLPAPSSSIAEPNRPAWDFVGRWLDRHARSITAMRDFWAKCEHARTAWTSEVRGYESSVILFKYPRDTANYPTDDQLQRLVVAIQVALGGTLRWYGLRIQGRWHIHARCPGDFHIAIQTDWPVEQPPPNWVNP